MQNGNDALRLIVTFYTTAAAMETEQRCKAAGIAGRLIPAPRSITSDCGLAWSMSPADRERLEAALIDSPPEIAEIRLLEL